MTAIVIAHRGASGYLPEHTLPGKALAYAMGADFIEQDVVASRDDELVVLHDIQLDRVSNVADVYPGRARADGRYYVRDFDMAELRSLKVWERMGADGSPVFSERFPAQTGDFRIHSLKEELELVRGLNSATGKNTGVYPEIKRPAWHREEGIDIAPKMLDLLAAFAYTDRDDAVWLQCFDDGELVRIRDELGCELRLVQLIAENSWGEAATDYATLRSKQGLKKLSATVDGIGPWLEQLYHVSDNKLRSSGLVEAAHAEGLKVHPYTFRLDSLPAGFATFESLIGFVIGELGADGLITDFPDVARRLIDAGRT